MGLLRTAPAHVPPELVFDFDIYADHRITSDVQGSYAKALADAPDVFYTRRNGGHWMVRRHQAITEIVIDPEHFSVREMQIPRVPNPPFFIPLSLDPPQNIPYRQVMFPKFSPKAIRELEPKIREWAIRIVDGVVQGGACDFIHDVSSLFPVSVFMELMGMPIARLREFRDIAEAFFSTHDGAELERLGGGIMQLLAEVIEQKRREPDNALISHFLAATVEGRPLTQDEILAMCFVLYLGGMDTVTNVAGFSFRHLAQDSELQARLVAHPDLIPKFVEEAIRCFGVINTPRLVVKDCQRFGAEFRTGDMVLCLLPMANRDDRVTEDPATFNIDRKPIVNMTFSTGPHLCVGQILARSEIRVLTEEWLKRIPDFSIEGAARTGFRIGTVTAIEALPIRWDAASRKVA